MKPEEILLDIISFDTQNSDKLEGIKQTDDALLYVADLLSNHGIKTEYQEYNLDISGVKIQRKNLIASLEKKIGLPNVGMQGHIDTVPVGSYKGNPFGEIKDDRVYGRGAVDMKGSVAGSIFAMIELSQNDYRSANPSLIITSDEEAHSFDGIEAFLKQSPEYDLIINCEPSNFQVYDKFKGNLYMILEIAGKSGHGSRQYVGDNAIRKGADVLSALVKIYDQLNSFERTISNNSFITDDSYTHMSSMNLGTINAGSKVNIIPDNMRIEFEMRLVDAKEHYIELIDNVVKSIEEDYLRNDKDIKISSNLVMANNPQVANIKCINHLVDRLSETRNVMVGFSEANKINAYGIPSIVYGVGNNSMSHTDTEYIEINELNKYAASLINFFQ